MAGRFQPIQPSFAGGVISWRMQARTDVEGYQQAVKDILNFNVLLQGPLDFRLGTEWLYSPSTYQAATRWVKVVVDSEDYPVMVNASTMLVFNPDGSLAQTLVSPFSSDASVDNIQYDQEVGADKIVIVNGLQNPVYISYSGGTFSTGNQAFTNAPSEWTGSVWPRTITYANGRSWFGGITGDEERFWGSTSGSFYDFDTGTGLDDEAIDRTIDEHGAIRWLLKASELTIGTAVGVYQVKSSTGVITPSDIDLKLQSAKGSKYAQALKEENSVFHISEDGRQLREFKYEFNKQGWQSNDLTFVSQDITNDDAIERYTQVINPDPILYCKTESGKVIALSYEATTGLAGWHKHEYNGLVIDLVSVRSGGTDCLWMVVNDDSALRVVRIGTQYLDQYVVQTSSPADNVITAIPSLVGEEVVVLVDGAYDSVVTLDGSGAGTTKYTGTTKVIGKAYSGFFESLNLDKGDPGGSAASLKKRWNKLFVHIYESALPLINGSRPATRSPSTSMGSVEPLKTEYVQVTTLGYTREGTVRIEQDLPFKTTVLAFLGQEKQN